MRRAALIAVAAVGVIVLAGAVTWLVGVPVRVVMVSRTTNDSAVGDVHYEEDVTLLLTSLTSKR